MENAEQEFVSVVREYERVIYKVCYLYTTPNATLNDLYQEVVLNLWKAFPKFRRECKISTWIYRIALNTCISFIRKEKNIPEIVTLTQEADRTEETDETQAMLRQLYRMINRLGQLEKSIILLYLEEKSYEEIAEITGLTLTNVATKLSRIKDKLLYITSGHYAKYGKDSFQPIHTPEEGEEYFLKPMNCPHHCMIYKNSPRSYKDLPLRLAEFGTVCRYEQSGELHGLTRVRSFTQDDAHIFCRPDQVKDEFLRVMDIISIVFESMDFENFEAQISLRDKVNREKYIGSDENWEKAERAIIEACEEKGLKAKIEYGEAAFYGPKLDFMVKDAIGRRWQLGTIQVDYNLPERFQLEYTGADNQKHRPVMVHRAPFGSMERFVAVLIEHTAGKFPLWLTPDQVAILPISEKFNDYAHEVKQYLKRYDIRAIVDERNEKIGRKIRDNEMKRIPYMLVVGEKEAENKEVAVRKQGEGDKGTMKFEEFAKKMNEEVQNMINKW